MELKFIVEKEINITTLKAQVGARYWEDATVNGEEDTEGKLIPCRGGENWCPIIDVDTGQIRNWKEGTTASLHYKSCDMNAVRLYDDSDVEVLEYDGYVPKCLSPKENGYGDYVIMDIDKKGFIQNWKFSQSDVFEMSPDREEY